MSQSRLLTGLVALVQPSDKSVREVIVFARDKRAADRKVWETYGDDVVIVTPWRREPMGAKCRLVTDGWVAK